MLRKPVSHLPAVGKIDHQFNRLSAQLKAEVDKIKVLSEGAVGKGNSVSSDLVLQVYKLACRLNSVPDLWQEFCALPQWDSQSTRPKPSQKRDIPKWVVRAACPEVGSVRRGVVTSCVQKLMDAHMPPGVLAKRLHLVDMNEFAKLGHRSDGARFLHEIAVRAELFQASGQFRNDFLSNFLILPLSKETRLELKRTIDQITANTKLYCNLQITRENGTSNLSLELC